MSLLSDALRKITPPRPELCTATHQVSRLMCDLVHPHPGEPHHDDIHGVRWQADEEPGVDW